MIVQIIYFTTQMARTMEKQKKRRHVLCTRVPDGVVHVRSWVTGRPFNTTLTVSKKCEDWELSIHGTYFQHRVRNCTSYLQIGIARSSKTRSVEERKHLQNICNLLKILKISVTCWKSSKFEILLQILKNWESAINLSWEVLRHVEYHLRRSPGSNWVAFDKKQV